MNRKQTETFTDAKKDLIFNVSERAFEEAVQGDATHCVFACGIRFSHPEIVYAEVRQFGTRVIFADGRRLLYQTSRELRLGIRAFDVSGVAQVIVPGRYTLLAPAGVRRIETRRLARQRYALRQAAGLARTYSPREVTKEPLPALETVRGGQWSPLPADLQLGSVAT